MIYVFDIGSARINKPVSNIDNKDERYLECTRIYERKDFSTYEAIYRVEKLHGIFVGVWKEGKLKHADFVEGMW